MVSCARARARRARAGAREGAVGVSSGDRVEDIARVRARDGRGSRSRGMDARRGDACASVRECVCGGLGCFVSILTLRCDACA